MSESSTPLFDSTVVRRGADATTFRDMVEYADLLAERPLEDLIRDLPGLAVLSRSKFDLTLVVLRRRLRVESVERQRELMRLADETSRHSADTEVHEAVRGLFA